MIQRSTTSDWAILLYPEPTQKSTNELETYKPPSMLPVPPAEEDTSDGTSDPTSNYVDFDEKWNMEETPEDEEDLEVTPTMEKAMPGTMVLVIGIILGLFTLVISCLFTFFDSCLFIF